MHVTHNQMQGDRHAPPAPHAFPNTPRQGHSVTHAFYPESTLEAGCNDAATVGSNANLQTW